MVDGRSDESGGEHGVVDLGREGEEGFFTVKSQNRRLSFFTRPPLPMAAKETVRYNHAKGRRHMGSSWLLLPTWRKSLRELMNCGAFSMSLDDVRKSSFARSRR